MIRPGGHILRNALWLYFRLVVITCADLLAVRLLTQALGLEDYGLFSAVSGVVLSLVLFNGTLQTTAQRFLAYELGSGERGNLKAAFSAVAGLTLLVGFLVVSIGMTGGEWFVENKLLCPTERLVVVRTVFCLGVGIVLCRILSIPFISALVAFERMDQIAKVSLIESCFMLAASGGVCLIPANRLTIYAGFAFTGAVELFFTYVFCCRRVMPLSLSVRDMASRRLGDVLRFMSWTSTNAVANVMRYQGVSMLISAYAGSLYTASWNVAMKIGFNLWGLVGSLQQAYNPQIVRSWAVGERVTFRRLVRSSLGWSFVVQTAVILPLFVWTEACLHLFVFGSLPPEAVAFTRCICVHFLSDALVGPLDLAVEATGNVARYMVAVAVLSALGFLLAWGFLAFGLSAWTTVTAVAATNVLALVYRLGYARRELGLEIFSRVCDNSGR